MFLGLGLTIGLMEISCSEAEKLKHLGKKFKAVLDGTYVPDIPPIYKIKYGIDFAKHCAELEKSKPQKVQKSKLYVYDTSTTSFLLKCGGYVDKCHYKVNWYWVHSHTSKKDFIESQIVDVCKLKEKQEEDEDW